MRRLLGVLLACALYAPCCAAVASAARVSFVDPSYFAGLHWRLIGPFRGGRALAVTGVPGEANHYLFGAVDGGVWESIDAGRTWKPIFDGEAVASIGAIAVAPSDPKTLYVGTGEADMRSDIAAGDGVYKSTDGGRTWTHIGLDDSCQIGKIVVDPHDANVAYVAALGHQYGPNAQRGVFKTTDGGKSWTKVLYENENVGAIDVVMDPSDANVLYAALWQTRRPPWNVYPPSNGPGSGLYKTTDGGTTWTKLAGGLPAFVGRIGLSISPADPQRVYASVDSDAAHGGIYRSDDAGKTWTRTDGEARIWQRGWYFGGITADPKNANVVYVMDTATYRSTDGGKTFDAILGDPTGDDYHTLWIDPDHSDRMILASDQGVGVSVDGAKTWSSWYNQPTGQFYHVITDDGFPYFTYGAQQDSGAAMNPSRTHYLTISQQDFHPIDVGGENGYLAPDPRHPNLVYGGTVTRENPQTGWEQNIDPTLNRPGTVWRDTWTMPLVFSPADPRALYFGRQNVFRTRDGGQTWQIVSPDLSRANAAVPANLDPATIADDNGASRHGVVYAIAPSPLHADVVWAGTDDGLIWVTRDGAKTWRNVTPPQLTAWSKVGIIEASHFDPNVAYAAIDRHRLDDDRPYIYRTRDGGATWTSIARGIPNGSYVNVIREDPTVRGLLYAGTQHGMEVSFDDGDHWQSLQLNLPVSSIRDIAVHAGDLVVATHGRALWIMDDISPLRQIAGALAAGGTYLFQPAPAYRLRPGNPESTPLPLDEPQAENAPTGLLIDYDLAGVPRTPVTIEIRDASGRLERRWSSTDKPKTLDPKLADFTPYWISVPAVPAATAGAHRFVWNFHEGSDDGPLVPPGRYAISLIVNAKTYTRSASILRDPRIAATDADLHAQYDLARAIEALEDRVTAARASAKAFARRHTLPMPERQLLQTQVIGVPAGPHPDDSMGAYSHDFTSLLFLSGALDYLQSAVESADAAPTLDMRDAYRKLAAIYARTLARMRAVERTR